VNRVLKKVLSVERAVIARGLSFPAGVFAGGRKKNGGRRVCQLKI
jgi:hypothetical protein